MYFYTDMCIEAKSLGYLGNTLLLLRLVYVRYIYQSHLIKNLHKHVYFKIVKLHAENQTLAQTCVFVKIIFT